MNTTDRTGCPAPLHGTSWAYQRHHCRCPDTRTAMRKWRKPQAAGTGRHNRNRGPVDPLNIDIALDRIRWGTATPPILNVPERRAIVATLTEQGWTARAIATALGLAQRNVVRHRSANHVAAAA